MCGGDTLARAVHMWSHWHGQGTYSHTGTGSAHVVTLARAVHMWSHWHGQGTYSHTGTGRAVQSEAHLLEVSNRFIVGPLLLD